MHYLELIRFKNCVLAGISGIVGYIISKGSSPTIALLIFLVIFFICGFGNIINDIYDIEIDKINKPHRPLPSGKVSLKEAKILAISFLAVGLLLSIFINFLAFLIAFINSLLLFLYARFFKRFKPIGNVIVSYLTGSTFLFGAVAGKNFYPSFILFLCSFLATWGREIIKDYEDIEGDKKENVVSLPILINKKALYIATFLILLAIILSPLPYILKIFGKFYLLGVLVCDLLLLYLCYKALKNREVSSDIKKVMLVIVLIFLISSVIPSF
ncbi:UbiA prenyltransferase [Methanocaldococcus infernus ME]|uniref:Digeranylgeranylglyceryl phosphate synthase n=1 Tax=Methanocaldococcus infernus (strain DSM 11812 / JCM 15783 / ME) TaxID=573063 RepID=D5VTL5_METIM|nr:UbiA family prenyltransferase [Methanocaldococcus infernus]ADG13918.1 UbiA prenyltransferase [Methanocaldococcus infernus ME]